MTRRQALRALEEVAERHGLRFDGQTRRGHYRWRHRDTGRLVVTHSHAGSWRALQNAERDMREAAKP